MQAVLPGHHHRGCRGVHSGRALSGFLQGRHLWLRLLPENGQMQLRQDIILNML